MRATQLRDNLQFTVYYYSLQFTAYSSQCTAYIVCTVRTWGNILHPYRIAIRAVQALHVMGYLDTLIHSSTYTTLYPLRRPPTQQLNFPRRRLGLTWKPRRCRTSTISNTRLPHTSDMPQ